MAFLRAFLAGFVSTLVFHQGTLWLLVQSGQLSRRAWDFSAVPPLGIPSVLSLAFWGGLWAVAIYWVLRRSRGPGLWIGWVLIGAIGPSLVALMLVGPLKGHAFAANWDPKIWLGAFLLNGAWGLGCALLLRTVLRGGQR